MDDKEIELFGVYGDFAADLAADAVALAVEIERGDRVALAHRLAVLRITVDEMVRGLAATSVTAAQPG